MSNPKVISFKELANLRLRGTEQTIVHCHGVYDLLHHGHLLHLRSAKKYGDCLVVTVTTDRHVNKGPGRPRFNEIQRADMLAALDIVDWVAINPFPKAIQAIKEIRPNFYIKGPDYKNRDSDITGGISEEEAAVNSVGGSLIFTDDETESSTELINEFFHQRTQNQEQVIENIRSNIGLGKTLEIIQSLGSMKVLVVGEPIVDTYVFCNPENLSSKSPSISANYIKEENYAGGSWAVARHLDALGCTVTLLCPIGKEPYAVECMQKYRASCSVKVVEIDTSQLPTPRKTRFIAHSMRQRMFELTNLDATSWAHAKLIEFNAQLKFLASDSDAVLALDFGHGLWEGDRIQGIQNVDSFLALNVQTNSGNYGYNFFHKHNHFDYLVLDEREMRLGMHDRFSPVLELASKVSKKIERPFVVTLGAEGSLYFPSPKVEPVLIPTYFQDPVDTTGAGDAFFAITALLRQQNAPADLIPFIGNIYAGLKTRIMGNKFAVSKIDLIRSISALLK
jgi:rfaE bifunctional protein nucleotidyltransferase chain/domain